MNGRLGRFPGEFFMWNAVFGLIQSHDIFLFTWIIELHCKYELFKCFLRNY